MIHFLVPRGHDKEITDYLEHWGQPVAARMSVRHYEDLLDLGALPSGTYVLAALDQLDPALHVLVRELCAQLKEGSGARARILNSADRTLLRYDLLDELHRLGMNRFRAVRARDGWDGVRFPVFLREERRHWGSLTWLLHNPSELERGVRQLLARGHRLEDLLVVEFCDTVDPEGVYRKYAAYVVGAAIIPRQLAQGATWILKSNRSEFTESMLLEEQVYVLENPHQEELRAIFEIAGTQYGRIDYAVLDGAIQTWEINLNPTIGRGRRPPSGRIPDELRHIRDTTNAYFYRRFQEAFESIDTDAESVAVPVRHDPLVLSRARTAVRHRAMRRRWAPLIGWLRPIRGVWERIKARLRTQDSGPRT